MYFMKAPILVIQDVELIKRVMVKDFEHFVDRSSSAIKAFLDTDILADKIMINQLTNAQGKGYSCNTDSAEKEGYLGKLPT